MITQLRQRHVLLVRVGQNLGYHKYIHMVWRTVAMFVWWPNYESGMLYGWTTPTKEAQPDRPQISETSCIWPQR